MHIVYHIGANCTDGERLLKSLMRNGSALAGRKVAVPGPGKYRTLLRETLMSLDGKSPAPDTREVLLDAIVDDQETERLILSNSTFLSMPPRVFEGGVFYGRAEEKLRGFASLFPGDTLEIFLALRNPATHIPAVFAQARARSVETWLGGCDPLTLRWSDLVTRIRAALPQAQLTVWCNEDTPLIWSELLRRMTGLPAGVPLAGQHDLLAAIMQPEGFARFEAYLATHPQPSDMQERRVIGAFLDKYARVEEIEEELDLPGWTEAVVSQMTQGYEADLAAVAAVPGVTFVAP
jgi:hypothetical protein